MYLPWWWLAQGSIYTWLYIYIFEEYCILTWMNIKSILSFVFLMIFLQSLNFSCRNTLWSIYQGKKRVSSCMCILLLLTCTIFKHEDISLIYVSLDLCIVGFRNNNIFCSTKEVYIFLLNWERSFRQNYKRSYELPWM